MSHKPAIIVPTLKKKVTNPNVRKKYETLRRKYMSKSSWSWVRLRLLKFYRKTTDEKSIYKFDFIEIKNVFQKTLWWNEKSSYKMGKNICNHIAD